MTSQAFVNDFHLRASYFFILLRKETKTCSFLDSWCFPLALWDTITHACDYPLCKQLSEKFICFPSPTEEQMWN